MADPVYDFKQTKPSLVDDADPTQIAPPADRLFPIPIFQPNGDRVANLQLKAVFLAPGRIFEAGSYNVQLFLNTGALGAYVAYGPVYTGLTENATVNLPFGDVDTAAYSGFFRITSAVSAGGGTSMLFTCSLLEAPPVKYDATGSPVSPVPAGVATAALQTSGNASLTSIDGKVATQTTLAAILTAITPPAAVLLGADWGVTVTKNVAVGSTIPTGFYGKNRNAAARWIQLHNTATVPAPGDAAEISIEVPTGGIALIDEQLIGPKNTQFPLGIAYAWSTTSGTYTAATAADGDTQVWGHPS